MDIRFYCPRWGSEHIPWALFCKKVREAGYDGIEWGIASTVQNAGLDEAWNAAAREGLGMIAQHYDTVTPDFEEHGRAYKKWFEKVKPYPKDLINAQTGKDFFDFDQNRRLVEIARAYDAVHETHRGKFLFAAHVAADYLERLPFLRITLDASHWVCTAESFLDDQSRALELALTRTDHIHARVGYPEGPQVPDPRVPEWQEALGHHLRWWDRVVAQKREQGKDLTVTTEFGPHPYMVNLPGQGGPIASQWDINVFMLRLLREGWG